MAEKNGYEKGTFKLGNGEWKRRMCLQTEYERGGRGWVEKLVKGGSVIL